ncbi:MaoC/PaaZ C-terminal domain-containing protein [Hyphomonas chukchiensis]|uniref:3-alpha,7-alpha, 12-alpha-trihydroxy-5-beta-cholest-24-enoyl-CoA hydratase n=1 Tax=Hyphomonas chukchiensis TaxID=1280947 RepID=A0A062UC77_9PROT|nr:MaoC/PaaZ C-terminal domain-containing protein [Hyphomonas chukchiensis]KCZ58694.1 hypothetical protein HY30_15930 [Hyphomonas chukchiensis]
MPIDYDRLMAWKPDDVVQSYSSRDTMLYALGLGLGSDPTDRNELRFTYEEGLQVLPTFPVVLGTPSTWWRETGMVDWQHVVHGEQHLKLHARFKPEGEVIGSTRVVDIIDKGPGRGALLYTERSVRDAQTGELLATATSTSFARKDGGFGGASGPTKEVHLLPDRAADFVFEHRTSPRAALIYRLSGDYNPLHADPDVAETAGFRQPILHGLCTYGVAAWAIVSEICEGIPGRLKSIGVRFSSPVYPGETLQTQMWVDKSVVSFRTRVIERDVVVLNNGHAEII